MAAADHTERCRALALTLDGDVAFSHVTALRLWGVDPPRRFADEHRLHVVTSSEENRPQRRDVVAHRTRQAVEVVAVDDLLVTSPRQTWVHVAVGLLPDDAVLLGDSLMRRERALTTPAALAEIAEATHKVKGIVRAREQIARMRPGTDSPMETLARLVVVGAGLPCPRVNEVVLDADGRYVARTDMSYPELRIAIEYDGDVHRTDRTTWRNDVRRGRGLRALGWIVLTVVADDLRDPRAFLADLRAALRARGALR